MGVGTGRRKQGGLLIAVMTLGSVLTACDIQGLGALARARDAVAPEAGQTVTVAPPSPAPLSTLPLPTDPLIESIPDESIPDESLPDLSLPDLSLPDLSIPDLPPVQVPPIPPITPVPPIPGVPPVPPVLVPPIPPIPPVPSDPPIPVPPFPSVSPGPPLPPVVPVPPVPSPTTIPTIPPPIGSPSPGTGPTAAERFGWGQPDRVDDFTGRLGTGWNVYNGAGHAGNGRRSPSAVSVANGIMTITGDSQGTTAGMAWNPGAKYGRWEGRVRAPASDSTYNALLLLWPDAENFPVGGEIDFMEMLEPTRQRTNLFLHYSAQNRQIGGNVRTDGTQWHNWAVEWTPTHIAAFLDGQEWFRTTDTSKFPPGPMHLCIQLDWFPENADGPVQQSEMNVDWVRFYAVP